jgi:hypothetical protein
LQKGSFKEETALKTIKQRQNLIIDDCFISQICFFRNLKYLQSCTAISQVKNSPKKINQKEIKQLFPQNDQNLNFCCKNLSTMTEQSIN